MPNLPAAERSAWGQQGPGRSGFDGDVVEGFGGRAIMTSERHPTGTDRLAEAVIAARLEHADLDEVVHGDLRLVAEAVGANLP